MIAKGETTPRTDGVGRQRSGQSHEDILESLRQHVIMLSKGELSRGDIDDDVDLYDAGYVDSVGVTEFVLRVKDQYALDLFDSQLGTELKSLRDVANRIHSAVNGRTL